MKNQLSDTGSSEPLVIIVQNVKCLEKNPLNKNVDISNIIKTCEIERSFILMLCLGLYLGVFWSLI